jgi:hypothetical protein
MKLADNRINIAPQTETWKPVRVSVATTAPKAEPATKSTKPRVLSPAGQTQEV